MKKIIVSIMVFSSVTFATEAEIFNGRLSAMGSSKAKINALMNTVTEFVDVIKSISFISENSAKVEIVSTKDSICRAHIYELEIDSNGTGYIAINPQRAFCE